MRYKADGSKGEKLHTLLAIRRRDDQLLLEKKAETVTGLRVAHVKITVSSVTKRLDCCNILINVAASHR